MGWGWVGIDNETMTATRINESLNVASRPCLHWSQMELSKSNRSKIGTDGPCVTVPFFLGRQVERSFVFFAIFALPINCISVKL